MQIWKWFKRKNAQAEVDKEKGTTKINAGDVAVEVDGKKITVAELEQAMIAQEAEEAEEAKKKELEAAQEMEPISMEESFVASNGKEYKVGDLVANWKKRNSGSGETDEEKAKREADEKAAAEEAEAKKNALKARANAAGLKDDATEEEVAKAEEEKTNAADAEAKAKAEEEAKEKEAAEKKENARKAGRAFFKELHNAHQAPEGTSVSVGKSRTERAEAWKKRNGGKNK